MRFVMLGTAAMALAACSEPARPDAEPAVIEMAEDERWPGAEARLEADVRFLADDLLEGREAGTRGHELAALYIAQRFLALGLDPVSQAEGYYQKVPLRRFSSNLDGGAEFSVDGEPFEPRFEFVGLSRTEQASVENAPVVYAGFGLVSDRHGRNDYEGIEAEGAIVAVFRGAPSFLGSEERATFSRMQARTAAEQGALGLVQILTPEYEENVRNFDRYAEGALSEDPVTWVGAGGRAWTEAPGLAGTIVMGAEGGRKLFERAGHDWEQVTAGIASEEALVEAVNLGIEASMRFDNTVSDFESPNVIGILPGTDAQLANEIVVVTAHLDHVGMKPQPDGSDGIYNGAMDNAVGVSALLEAARELAANPPKRTVMFAALTGEEKGLQGSDYLARNPVLLGKEVVANINLDMPVLTFPFVDLVAFGSDRSSLGPIVARAGEGLGIPLVPDPIPEQGIFTRSDHFSFVKQGVPSVFLFTGFGGEGAEEFPKFLSTHYHQPSDEIDLVMFDQLALFAALNTEVIRGVADVEQTPVWNTGDFFAETFGGPMAEK
ncbi:M28 family peptidase [Parvularcula lutaonensis]|uniref:M28 family peptidase n=1 Tax=Parvularcula lutaonensis TaxID=491923 RepID=A0ABV7MDX9_9PROT|nr:M28 family peptidase [Parvularcula lutaonensis]GGY51501.1 aminopeptidase [Parvularcula lutaonensis]